MIKYGNIKLITTLPLLTVYHLYLLLIQVRLGGYIVNLSDFYSYRLIGKLTFFVAASGVQFSESDRGQFHFRHTTCTQQLKVGLVWFSLR